MTQLQHKEQQEKLQGALERVTFHNEENGFSVLKVKVRGQRDLITVIGNSILLHPGEWLDVTGTWINDPNHGRQFKASNIQASHPTQLDGLCRYLASGMIRGIGKVYAKKIVDKFGDKVFNVLRFEPHLLQHVEGIGPQRATQIVKSWEEYESTRDIMVFLHQHGISANRAVKIYQRYGDDAIDTISHNPYQLSQDIQGIGFTSADQIAQSLGVNEDSPQRIQAGLHHVLKQATSQGHSGLPEILLLDKASDLLDCDIQQAAQCLDQCLANGDFVHDSLTDPDTGQDTPSIFPKLLFNMEVSIRKRLKNLSTGDLPWSNIDLQLAVPRVEKKLSIQLAASQKEALGVILGSKVSVLTGGPGVGKTTLINSLLQILKSEKLFIKLCAPTGRAAKRLSETTGMEAQTIHRLLQPIQGGGFAKGSDSPLMCNLLIVDESSMVDIPLMCSLLKAMPDDAALLLVGDVDQLPSVGPGNIFADIIKSGNVATAHLTEIFRQAKTSQIITNAHLINQGQMPVLDQQPGSDFYVITCKHEQSINDKLIQLVTQRIPHAFGLDSVADVQVLCPMNKGPLGTQVLNANLQKALNSRGLAGPTVARFGWAYATRDKVMQLVNNYDKDVFNGDIGFVRCINLEDDELVVNFDGRDITYQFDELDQITLSYATTIHKSQGSEYPAVIIPMSTQHYMMLKKNLIYTGVTRGKKLVVLLAQPKALSMAVTSGSKDHRWTKLQALIENW